MTLTTLKLTHSVICAITASVVIASSAIAHDGVKHEDLGEALQHQEQTSPDTLGFPEVKGGDFNLIDHN